MSQSDSANWIELVNVPHKKVGKTFKGQTLTANFNFKCSDPVKKYSAKISN